jgi:hypothetical protein
MKNFDWKFYINYHTDLKKCNLDNEEKAFSHWLNYGIYEDRLIRKNLDFDWEFYINYYPDLLNNNINNENLAHQHWSKYGSIENRISNNTLLINEYLLEPEKDNREEKRYIFNSYIDNYCKKYATYARPYYEKKNYLDIDLYFYKKGNNIELNTTDDLMKHFNENYNGLIYHPKQLLNIYKDIELFKINNNIVVNYENNKYILSDFLNKFIYKKDFNYFSNFLIKNIIYKLKSSSLLLLVFIGDYNIGLNLINKIIEYKNLEKFNIAFCFNNEDNYKLLINIIENNFKYYASYISNEFGNDIIPTLLMYNHIKKENVYKHIIKLQTKTNIDIFNQLTNYLLTKKLKDLILGFKQYSNCINYNDFYMRIINDQFNKHLIEKYKDYIDFNKSFIIGTIFYTKGIIFDKILDFMINDFKQYLFNNMYDNNCTFFNDSYIHFLERLFGVIKY